MQGNELAYQAIISNINVVNDNIKTVYDKLDTLVPTDLNPVITGISNLYQLLSTQIAGLKTSVDANTDVMNQVLDIVKTIPGTTVPEVRTEEIAIKSKKK
jgi:hypothetical protein